MDVVILSGADSDLDDIYSHLEERAEGRGERFLVAVDRQLGLIRTFPKLGSRAFQTKLRRVKVGRSPYGMFYAIEGKRLMVIAIQDLRQDPAMLVRIIRGRL